MESIDIKKILSKINLDADWIGIREVNEKTTYRVIRDLNPESDSTSIDHGVMVEVLVNGQFGYYGTHKLNESAIIKAAKKAYDIATAASKFSIFSFQDNVRPPSIGEYSSPYETMGHP